MKIEYEVLRESRSELTKTTRFANKMKTKQCEDKDFYLFLKQFPQVYPTFLRICHKTVQTFAVNVELIITRLKAHCFTTHFQTILLI